MPIYPDNIAAAIRYNLQMLPDMLVVGITVLSIILSNPSLVVLAIGAVGSQLLTGAMGRLLMKFGTASEARVVDSANICNSTFTSRFWNLLAGSSPDRAVQPASPSMYLSTIGYFFGFGLALLQIYKEEIDARVVSRSTLIATTIIAALILFTVALFRIYSGCESILGAVASVALGLLLGYIIAVGVGYGTDRRGTNIWGIPLLKDRINNGSPLYICPAESSD